METKPKTMLNENEIRELVAGSGSLVNEGRPIKQIIEDGDIPRLNGCTILEGKVSSVAMALLVSERVLG